MAVQRRQIGMLELSEFDFEEHYFNGTNNSYNGSLSIGYQELSYYFFSNQDSFCEVALYSLMFVVAAIGNMTVFVTLIRYRHRKSRMNLMILHVAIADLIVTFIMTPLEIIRRASFQWVVGNPACQILLPTRAFGPYLSSLILVCISLDRYFTFLYPEKINYAQRRGKIMLGLAWTTSILITILQSFIYHVETLTEYSHFIQCVVFFPTLYHQKVYHTSCLLTVYGIPMSIIIFCYSRILWKISRRSRNLDGI